MNICNLFNDNNSEKYECLALAIVGTKKLYLIIKYSKGFFNIL